MNVILFREQLRATKRRFEQAEQTRLVRAEQIRKVRAGEMDGVEIRKIDSPHRIARRMMGLIADHQAKEAILSGALTAKEDALETPVGVDVFERIIGQSNLMSSSFLSEGSAASRAVGRIAIRGVGGNVLGFGTGWMASSRLMMTNNHVLESATTAAKSVIQFDFIETLGGTSLTPIEFNLDPLVFFVTNRALDYTLVAVESVNRDGVAITSRGWNPLIAESGKAIVGERVNIIQHPGGERQQLALRQNEILDVPDSFLHYSTDTKRGSSGSPVFNDQWQVAALHHAGVPQRDPQGRILLTTGDPWDGSSQTVEQISWIANEGVRISRIVEDLRARDSSFSDERLELLEGVFLPRPHSSPGPSSADEASSSPSGVIGDDGRAHWTIPLHVSMGLGSLSIPSADKPATGSQMEKPGIPKGRPGRAAIDDGELQAALAQYRAHETEMYYDDTQDQADISDYYRNIPDELSNEPLRSTLRVGAEYACTCGFVSDSKTDASVSLGRPPPGQDTKECLLGQGIRRRGSHSYGSGSGGVSRSTTSRIHVQRSNA